MEKIADPIFTRIWDVKKELRVRDYVEGRNTGTSYFFTCPECGKSNCVSSDGRAFLYNCFSCGESGDVLDILERKTGIPKFKIALDKALELGVITQAEYLTHGGKKEFAMTVKPMAAPRKEKEEQPVVPLADEETLNLVYTELLSLDAFRLTKEAEKYLAGRGEKNFSEFFSYHKEFSMKELLVKIQKVKPSFQPSDFAGIPGFYVEYDSPEKKSGMWKFISPQPANIGLIVRSGMYRVVGLQMRISSKTWTGPRYLWVSSAQKNNPPKEGKPVTGMGRGPGSPCHVVYPLCSIDTGVIFVTEGIFKARKLANTCKGVTISLQGVTNSASLPHTVGDSLINPYYYSVADKGKVKDYSFAFMFDADMVAKEQVYKACRQAYQRIIEQFPSKDVVFYLWPMHLGKGIDDLMENNPGNWRTYIRGIRGDDFIALMDSVRSDIMSHSEFAGKSIQEILKDTTLYKEYSKRVYQTFWMRFTAS